MPTQPDSLMFELSKSLKGFPIYEIFFRTSSFNYLLINKLINSAIKYLESGVCWSADRSGEDGINDCDTRESSIADG